MLGYRLTNPHWIGLTVISIWDHTAGWFSPMSFVAPTLKSHHVLHQNGFNIYHGLILLIRK